MDTSAQLIRAIAQTGRQNTSYPSLNEIEPFSHFFMSDRSLDYAGIDKRDGACTRREVLMRFLLLCAVIDQGPDLVGVRKLLVGVTNALYQKEVRFLHTPMEFFKELGVAVDEILEKHQTVKSLRSAIWGKENQANAERYNLFMDNSKQVLSYAVFRWGVPLALPLLLERDCTVDEKRPTVLIDYLESWPSAEEMSQQVKDNGRYGLGKAIGDKACHLFAKWVVSSFRLTRRGDTAWRDFSFEVPYDSNAGRVLWRTGYFLKWASEKDYIRAEVVQPGQGKQGLNYIRVTNIRGMSATQSLPSNVQLRYIDISLNHLKTHKRQPRKVEIQRIQHAYLLEDFANGGLGVADFDEGLIFVGTKYCFNHAEPLCGDCPLNKLCVGYKSDNSLITKYRT
jgi:hypothetical protein